MERSLQTWLAQHGQRNLFEALSEGECQQLLANLESQLQQEELLAAEIHSLVAQGQRDLTQRRDALRTPPHGVRAVALPPDVIPPDVAPPEAPSEREAPAMAAPRRWRWHGAMAACGLLLMVSWSALLYQWGFQRGSHQAALALGATQPVAPANQR